MGSVYSILVQYELLGCSLSSCCCCYAAPQLLYGGATHVIPQVATKTLTYKTAAFEPVEADTPADAQLIELKETEHSYDVLVPAAPKIVHTPAVAYAGLAGYPYGLAGYPYGLAGLPVLAAAPAAEEPAAEE